MRKPAGMMFLFLDYCSWVACVVSPYLQYTTLSRAIPRRHMISVTSSTCWGSLLSRVAASRRGCGTHFPVRRGRPSISGLGYALSYQRPNHLVDIAGLTIHFTYRSTCSLSSLLPSSSSSSSAFELQPGDLFAACSSASWPPRRSTRGSST